MTQSIRRDCGFEGLFGSPIAGVATSLATDGGKIVTPCISVQYKQRLDFLRVHHLLPMIRFFSLVLWALLLFVTPVHGVDNKEEVSPEGLSADRIESIVAKLSDEQVRSLLLAELKKEPLTQTENKQREGGFVARLGHELHLLDGRNGGDFSYRLQRAWRHSHALPTDFNWTLRQFAPDNSPATAWKNIVKILLVFCAAFLIELLFRGLTSRMRRQFQEHPLPDLGGMMRLWAAMLGQLPALIHLVVFLGAALILFFFSPAAGLQTLRYLFLDLLYILMAVRLARLLSLLFVSPAQSKLRLLPISDEGARRLHSAFLFLATYVITAVSLLALLREVGVQRESISLLAIGFATTLIVLIAAVVLVNRRQVAAYFLSDHDPNDSTGWLGRQLADFWHVPVLAYLLLVWSFLLYNEFSGSGRQNGAFLLSLFVIPVFLVMDRVAGWVIGSVVKTLRIYDLPADGNLKNEEQEEQGPEQQQKERQLVIRLWRIARLVILAALTLWMMSLWGYRIPHAGDMIGATFDILLTLSLALVFWRLTSGYIERKIREATPEEEEEEQDDEWGGAVARGRSYTLLPMVRKFLGTVLVVMVTLIILSSIGVDIGPLLAGAGVVGLAIGFGAQKLVSDIFSGFFYLLDDAFRVGEYLQAGSVSGTVEAITLRNIKLRHHRGMLQIVPYSELGSITNFMRGGIVVKFNLEFPYDSNIDQIRKIIKKVGQAMLEDPEFGKDFIRPVKSQGVREIANSVMVIRVKFTAQPGAHFVIRREAYRRITEALAAKGIHYAHRKVIVAMPPEEEGQRQPNQEKVQRALEAGAAAGHISEAPDDVQ